MEEKVLYRIRYEMIDCSHYTTEEPIDSECNKHYVIPHALLFKEAEGKVFRLEREEVITAYTTKKDDIPNLITKIMKTHIAEIESKMSSMQEECDGVKHELNLHLGISKWD